MEFAESALSEEGVKADEGDGLLNDACGNVPVEEGVEIGHLAPGDGLLLFGLGFMLLRRLGVFASPGNADAEEQRGGQGRDGGQAGAPCYGVLAANREVVGRTEGGSNCGNGR